MPTMDDDNVIIVIKGCPVGALGVSCWCREERGMAVHDASGDRSRWGGLVFVDDSRGVNFQVQETLFGWGSPGLRWWWSGIRQYARRGGELTPNSKTEPWQFGFGQCNVGGSFSGR